MRSLPADTSFFSRARVLVTEAAKKQLRPMSSEEALKQTEQGEPTLADKLAEASRAANITGEGGG